MIQNISIEKLSPHPSNPRTDLGELGELAESIKVQGILQNLTVVPQKPGYCISCQLYNGAIGKCIEDHDKNGRPPCAKWESKGTFIVVIGHRRLAAAKLAGLTEVPCSIADMTEQEQVATMLLENMQRSDLTIYEQAHGFQMMLDFGESVANISEKTGFSETTVRRRVKLLELDPVKFKKSAERNVTLMDYAELEKIEDIELRNKVLDTIGTPNFKYELQKAIDKEKSDKNMAKYIEQLNTFAKQIDNSSGMRYVASYYLSQNDDIKAPEDAEDVEYFYVVSNYGYITLYKEAVETEEDTAANKQRELQRAKYNALNEITERAFDLRREFIKGISNAKAKKNLVTIIEYSVNSILESYNGVDVDDMIEMLDITIAEDKDEVSFEDIVDGLRQQPERYLLVATYCGLDSKSDRYYNWDCSYSESEDLDRTYAFLEALGYEISDEEQAMRDGTHELFEEVE